MVRGINDKSKIVNIIVVFISILIIDKDYKIYVSYIVGFMNKFINEKVKFFLGSIIML